MAVTATDIQAMPGLSGTSTATADAWIGIAADFVSASYFGAANVDSAVKYWVAHAIALEAEQGMASAGPVASQKVGGVQTRFAVPTMGAAIGSIDWLKRTSWGTLYLSMVRRYLGNVTLSA